MSDDYAEYEKECKRIRQRNAKLIDEFAEWLVAKGLSETTVRRHHLPRWRTYLSCG